MSVFRGQIKNGKVDFGSDFNTARFREWCKEHPGAWIRIEHEKPARSMSQNRYYWVYLEAISRETGHSPDELHEWAKRKFLSPRFIRVMGEDLKIPSTTTELKKTEFGEYLDRICAETNVPLPNPADAGYISNY